MAKHRDSTYVPGQRSPFWLKVKAVKSDDFVVMGWTPGPDGGPFDGLLLGFHEAGRLMACGTVAGGFDPEDREAIARRLLGLPLDVGAARYRLPVATAPVQWCQPELVVSVRYSEWAADGTLRFPIFNGVRPEVHPSECIRHRPRVVLAGRTQPGTPVYDLTWFPF